MGGRGPSRSAGVLRALVAADGRVDLRQLLVLVAAAHRAPHAARRCGRSCAYPHARRVGSTRHATALVGVPPEPNPSPMPADLAQLYSIENPLMTAEGPDKHASGQYAGGQDNL